MLKQNDFEYIQDQLKIGNIDANEANIMMVLFERVRVIEGRIPASVRKALNAAVKEGRLGHMKKDGFKPEVYYHPKFKTMAIDERNEYHNQALSSILKVCG